MSSASIEVGIRELRDHLSAVLDQVRAGRTVTITDRNRPIAQLTSLSTPQEAPVLQRLVIEGRVAWGGARLGPPGRRPPMRGASVAEAVVEDRR